MRCRLHAVTFHVDLKSNMAALASDLLTHFHFSPKNGLRDLLHANVAQMFLMRCRLNVATFYVDLKSEMAALASDWLTHFQLLLKNGCSDLPQTWHNCNLQGPGYVLLLFMWIRNPIWPPLPFNWLTYKKLIIFCF